MTKNIYFDFTLTNGSVLTVTGKGTQNIGVSALNIEPDVEPPFEFALVSITTKNGVNILEPLEDAENILRDINEEGLRLTVNEFKD